MNIRIYNRNQGDIIASELQTRVGTQAAIFSLTAVLFRRYNFFGGQSKKNDSNGPETKPSAVNPE